MPSLTAFHRSTAAELIAVTDRVRNLVKHWGEDGRYKEAVLRNVIRRFLPTRYLIGTGFIVNGRGYEEDHEVSTQIDLIVYDSNYPVLFMEGDFVILTADAVRGIIEVKANLENQNLRQVISKANSVGAFVGSGKLQPMKPLFNGIFSYDSRPQFEQRAEDVTEVVVEEVSTALGEPGASNYVVNHIAFDSDHFVKMWFEEGQASLYTIRSLSFAYFISNLLMCLTDERIDHERKVWFPRDKELDRRRQFQFDLPAFEIGL